jgi:hypothetical protein
MRFLLRFLGTRYGVALLLVAFVAAVVSVARVVSGPAQTETAGPPEPLYPTVLATPSDLGDDGLTPSETPSASLAPGAKAIEVVAMDFARAWLPAKGVTSARWLKGMEPFATKNLLHQLRNTDPAYVRVTAIRGPARIRRQDSQEAEVSISVSPGVLILQMFVVNGKWLVDGIDWDQP